MCSLEAFVTVIFTMVMRGLYPWLYGLTSSKLWLCWNCAEFSQGLGYN